MQEAGGVCQARDMCFVCPVTTFAHVVSVPSLCRVFLVEEYNCYIIFQHKACSGARNRWFTLVWKAEFHGIGLLQGSGAGRAKSHERSFPSS